MKPRSRHEAGEMEDDGGAWMNDHEGPKMAEFLFWLKSEPKAEAPLKNMIMISSPSTGGLEKNTLRLVSKQFKDDTDEGIKSIKWVGSKKYQKAMPNNLMILINPVRDRDRRLKDRLPNLKSIDCKDLDTLMDLNGCSSGLEALGCCDCNLIQSLAPLAACTNLRQVSLSRTKVSSLQPLMGCVKLEWLNINNTLVSDLRPLSACVNLKVLRMFGTRVSDLSPLSGLHQLRLIDMDGVAITDLSPLSSLPHLETLLCCNTKISDLTPLSKCSELKALDIEGTEVKSLTPLLQCKKLKYLNHGNLKGKDEDQTEGYAAMLNELMPDLLITRLVMGEIEETISIHLQHIWDHY